MLEQGREAVDQALHTAAEFIRERPSRASQERSPSGT